MITLKNVLLLNAVSSGATGLGLILFPGLIANLFGTNETAAFIGTGIFLVLFAGMVGTVGLARQIGERAVRFIVTLDSLWVVKSLAIVVLQLFGLSTLGYILIGAVAAWVGLMAYLQANGLKQLTTAK